MNDAIALLAISQLVCLASMVYLYSQLQALRAQRPARRTVSPRVHPMARSVTVAAQQTAAQAARQAYTPTAPAARKRTDAATLAARISEMGVDVPALARRMQKSEAEVRLLLRRGAVPTQEIAS
jgi:hypothetical protein